MKKSILLLLIVALGLLNGCMNEAQQQVNSTNNNFQIELLFQVDSIKVYRFYDGHYHYFCKDMTMQNLSCGKNCRYEEEIKTLKK